MAVFKEQKYQTIKFLKYLFFYQNKISHCSSYVSVNHTLYQIMNISKIYTFFNYQNSF